MVIIGGIALSGQQAYDALQEIMNPTYDFSQFSFTVTPLEVGLYAHRTLGAYMKGREKEGWRSEGLFKWWKMDISLRLDLYYMYSGVNSVWKVDSQNRTRT